MSKYFNIAIVGATGAVGRVFLNILEQRAFPVNHLKLLASRRSAGARVQVAGQEFEVQETTEDSFRNIDFAFISAGSVGKPPFRPRSRQ